MVSDLLQGQQSGSSIIDNYIKNFEKEKEFTNKMSSQKKQTEKLRQNMEQERKRIKLEHAQGTKHTMIKKEVHEINQT